MSESSPRPLQWSKQFSVLPTTATPHLKGDKIILPASALEQLLSAATTTVATTAGPQATTFDPFNPYSYAAETRARQQLFERHQDLPHPLSFRLVNPENGRIVFAGIREFSAPDETIGLSPFLSDVLGLNPDTDISKPTVIDDPARPARPQEVQSQLSRLTVHLQVLPKGTFVKLRPLEAGYDPDDWKALLEQYLRDTFTTLTNKEIIHISAGKETFRFLVDELKPNEEGISLIDTDIEVDIEPLNEEQARETLQKLALKSQRKPGSKDGSSVGGPVKVGETQTGQILPGEYVDFTIEHWDRSADLEVEASTLIEAHDVDIFVSPFGSRHRSRPREDSHVFGDISSRSPKRIKIQRSNAELEDASALWVALRGYKSMQDSNSPQEEPIGFTIRVAETEASDTSRSSANKAPIANGDDIADDEEICSNCRQIVPKRTMFLHQNFCIRNNVYCPKCNIVFQKTSPEWKEHWHCEHDNEYGSSSSSKDKHNQYLHTPASCPACDFEAPNMPALAHHRTTLCPAKLILCQFCHLQVPQQDADDPSSDSAEVLLSGLTPHEVTDGARTTECHLCNKIVRLRDMSAHLRHHDLQRLSRSKPSMCRNVNCGRTLDGVSSTGEVKLQPSKNELGLCDACFGPLYVSMYDPDGKALRRRVERKLLTQLLTGCGQKWCHNELCKSGRQHLGIVASGQSISSKDAMTMIRPVLDRLTDTSMPLSFCTDEASQRRRTLATMVAAENSDGAAMTKGKGGEGRSETGAEGWYEVEWCIAALEVEGGDLDKARAWLKGFAPTRAETQSK